MAEPRVSAALIEAIGRLKEVPRTGWLDRGIPPDEVESVADHSFGVALLAWLLTPEELDRARTIELALLHDLAEASVGDATPYDRDELAHLDPDTRRNWLNQRHVRTDEQRATKLAKETAAIEALADTLPPASRQRLLDRWAELMARESPEARFVKQLDILETWQQSRRYAERHPEAPMASFALEARTLLDEDTFGTLD